MCSYLKSPLLCFLLQEKNRTNAPGRGARGSLLVPMNWRGISASTRESNPSSAQTVTVAFHVRTILLFTGNATCLSECLLSLTPVTLFFCFLHTHFNLDSAGLDLWVYTIKSLCMVSNTCYLTLLCPCHGSDLKNVNTSFSSGDAKQTPSAFNMFIVSFVNKGICKLTALVGFLI